MNGYLIGVFQDTQKYIKENQYLAQETEKMIRATKIFPERYETTRVMGHYATRFSVTAETTFQAARRLKEHYVKVGVLNFANAVSPGGGVEYGARSQEEDLCRSSNLYSGLTISNAYRNFYQYNNYYDPYYSDRVIYTPNVTVFKSEGPQYQYSNQWFQVDVLTCPAPNLNGIEVTDFRELQEIYERRIRNILAVAEAHGIQTLVLGAFGCGVFSNPPDIMAKSFLNEIVNGIYKECFCEIVFAIKADTPQGARNFSVFQKIICPWQDNPLYGKQVAILGDSISTYSGYNPRGYSVYYTSDRAMRLGVYSESDTWWWKLLEKMQGYLLINNSCSGSPVSGNYVTSANSDERLSKFWCRSKVPDVILIYVGTNDYVRGVPLEPRQGETVDWNTYWRYFRTSYQMMLWKLKEYYPETEIYCATICCGTQDPDSKRNLPDNLATAKLKDYNRVIQECAKSYGCHIVDIAQKLRYYESIDGVHPTAAGMYQIAKAWEVALDNNQNTPKKKKSINYDILLTTLIGIIVALVTFLVIVIVFYIV